MSKPPDRAAGPSHDPPRLALEAFLPYRLSVTANRVSEVIALAYGALYGLKAPEWRVIAAVAETGALTQQGVCARTRMDKVTVHRAAVGLLARGLLVRDAHPADRRSHHLSLSEAGRALHADVAPRALDLEARLFRAFDPDQLRRFTTLLDAVDRAAEDLLAEAARPSPR